ncbi:MAG: hypothetical protein ACKOUM_04665, partial [Sphingopyxis sp.]
AVPVLLLGVGARGRMWRFGALAVAAVGAAVALVSVAPGCAAGPFATLDPLVRTYWYLNVREGLPAWYQGDILFAYSIAPSLVGLMGTALAWRRAGDAGQARLWLIALGALCGAVAVSLPVLRTAATAHLFALPGTAWLAIAGWRWAQAKGSAAARVGGSLLPALTLPPVAGSVAAMLLTPVITNAAGVIPTSPQAEQCNDPLSIAALNQLPPALVFAQLDIGPHLLQHSHHSVMATGHHRNSAVMHQVISAFLSTPQQARTIVQHSGARYLLICNASRESEIYRTANGQSLADALARGHAPGWLVPVRVDGAGLIRIYRVAPPLPYSGG